MKWLQNSFPMLEHADKLNALEPLLKKLYWHHRSQSRGALAVRPEYNADLAAEIEKLIF